MAIRDLSVVLNDEEALYGNSMKIEFDDFSGHIEFDDLYYSGTPVQFEQTDVAGFDVDANGVFHWWRTIKPVVFTISLFPNSPSDKTLGALVETCISNENQQSTIEVATIQYGGKRMVFRNGLLVSGLPGANVGGDNRMGPKTYRFAFESFVVE